jgi:hypothetical protein
MAVSMAGVTDQAWGNRATSGTALFPHAVSHCGLLPAGEAHVVCINADDNKDEEQALTTRRHVRCT